MAEHGETPISKADERAAFVAERAPVIAAAVCDKATPWSSPMPLSKFFGWFETEDQLVVVGCPFERQLDLDLGFGFGLAHAGDRELVLVMPAGAAEPTRRRLPWLDVPVSVWTFDDAGSVEPSPLLSRQEVRAACDDAIVTATHQLGKRSAWVDRLTKWADTSPELVSAHRSSYLAWHCRGRMALKIRTSRGGRDCWEGA